MSYLQIRSNEDFKKFDLPTKLIDEHGNTYIVRGFDLSSHPFDLVDKLTPTIVKLECFVQIKDK